jgi:predicted regulator of Ras-like GTPase activity (Roadblock/LC7/MglB family)
MPGFEALSKVLFTLRELDGARASFLISSGGQLLASESLSNSPDELAAVAPRVPALHRALAPAVEGALDVCVVRFADRKLHIRKFQRGFLCVVTDLGASGALLRMALSLAVTRLGGLELEHAAR